MKITFDEATDPLTLEPVVERKMGVAPATEGPLDGRLGIGKPGIVPMTRDVLAADPELAAFLAPAGHAFCLVKLVVSLRPKDGEPFKQAWLSVTLQDPAGGEAPTAWSMSPQVLRATDEWPIELNVGVGLKLGVATVDAKVATGKQKNEVTILEAFGEGENEPTWELASADARELSGIYRFGLVVQYPTGTKPIARIGLKAMVERKRAVFFPYRARFGNEPELEIALA